MLTRWRRGVGFILPGYPKKVLSFDIVSNNSLLFYCLNTFRFLKSVDKLRF